MSFGLESDCCGLAKRLVLFFDLLSTNLGNKLFLLKEEFVKEDLKKFDLSFLKVSLGHIIRILKQARESNMGGEKGFEVEIMRKIKMMLKPLVGYTHWPEVLALMESVLGRKKEEGEDRKKERNKNFKEAVGKFLQINGLVKSKRFEQHCKTLLGIIERGNSVFIGGKIGRAKSTVVKAAAFVFSLLNGIFKKCELFFINKNLEKLFTLHAINLDALHHSHLIQNPKMKSVLDQLFMKCLLQSERKDLIDFTTLRFLVCLSLKNK